MSQTAINKRVAAVTGATSGFGKAIARTLAQKGLNLVITGRRQDRLDELCEELYNDYQVRCLPLCFDVRNRTEVETQTGIISKEYGRLDVLVNNAGLALGRSPIDTGDPDDWDAMLDTNVKGLLYVTRAWLPLLKAAEQAEIINVSSIAGKEAYPDGNVYCGSKHAVDALTRAMRIDLVSYGIKVGSINPGAAETEFSLVRFKGDRQKAERVYDGFEPLHAQDVADAVWFMLSRPAHVCINDLTIMPTAQASAVVFDKK